MRRFQHRDRIVTYEVIGHGRDVLLLHGLGSEAAQVKGAFAQLPGCRIICPDMPGHGGSTPAPWGFSSFASLTIALLDHLGVEIADLGGISMGAGIALSAALSAPHRARTLLLIRPAWLDGPALPHLRLIERMGSLLADRGIAAAQAWLDGDAEMRQIELSNPLAALSIRSASMRRQAVTAASVLPAMVHDQPIDNLDNLREVRCPTLVAGNDDDPLHPAALARTLASHVPGASYVDLPSRYTAAEAHAEALRRSVFAFLKLNLSRRPA